MASIVQPPKRPRDAGPLLIVAAVFLLYTALFFGIVALDPDNGRDFVAADLLAHGKLLYRDVGYYFGPLAPWTNAALLRLFGASMTVLLVAGATVSLAIVTITYFLGRQFLSPGVAALGAVIVVAHAVYGYNMFTYAVPYTFAATYGLLFSLVALYSALRATEQPYSPWDLLAGAAAGLALACKQEFAAASIGILLTGLALRLPRDRRRLLPAVLASSLCYGAVAAVFGALLLRRITVAEFLANVLPPQAPAWRRFYENAQYWGPNAWIGIRESVAGFVLNFAFIIWATCFAAMLAGVLSRRRPDKGVTWVLLLAGPLIVWQAHYLWYYPLLLHGVLLACILTGRTRGPRLKPALLAIGAGLFLIRVLPHPTTSGYYGLLYFIPSLVAYLYLCFEIVIPWLCRFFPERTLRVAMASVFVACFVVPHFFVTHGWAHRAEWIDTERGRFRVEREEAAKARVVLEEIRRYSSPGDRILMLPHACMYYFVSNRQPASRYLAYTYGQILDGPQEQEEIARLRRTPPKLIVIDDFHHRLHVSGPVDTFGAAYNAELYRWITQNYREVRTIPYQDRQVHFFAPNSVVPESKPDSL